MSAVSAGGVSLAPKGATGDLFEESDKPTGPGPIRRQDLLGVGTYQAHGIFLGTVNLSGGQIVYAGSTTDQDNNTYAVGARARTWEPGVSSQPRPCREPTSASRFSSAEVLALQRHPALEEQAKDAPFK